MTRQQYYASNKKVMRMKSSFSLRVIGVGCLVAAAFSTISSTSGPCLASAFSPASIVGSSTRSISSGSVSSSFTPSLLTPARRQQQPKQLHRSVHSFQLFLSSRSSVPENASDLDITTLTATNGDLDEVSFDEVSYQDQQTLALRTPGGNALLDQVVLVNGSILVLLGLAVAYGLFHVSVEALLALWEYDLGPHGPELTKMAVAFDVLLRLPLDWISSYESLVPTNPIFYKACTSGVAYALGDFISQVYQGKTLESLDLPRSLRSGAAGFIAHGPLCHFWLIFMETYLDFGGAWWATGIKVTADLTVWSVFLNGAYSFIIGTLAGKKPQEVYADVKVTLWPALKSAWRFWPFVHTVSFSHAVPMDLKLLWVDIMEVVWVTILSKVANEDKIAQLEANPQLEAKNVFEEIPEVDPSLEIELAHQAELVKSGSSTAAVANMNMEPENDDFLEVPKKVLAACWPLIAMWPVLYGGYRVEMLLGLVE